MGEAIGKYLALAAVAAVMLRGLVSDTSAATVNGNSSVSVVASISFDRVIAIGKESDVSFGDLQSRSNDRVMLDSEGNMRLGSAGGVIFSVGRPGVITIGDSRDQVLNFLHDNYRQGGNILSLDAHCVLKSAASLDCDQTPISGKRENTLFIGMDITVGSVAGPVDNKTEPSFDISVVYQ
jgi:hypothetical protein